MSELDVPMRPETPDVTGAYPRLTDEQIMLLSRYGEKRLVDKGEALFREGDPDCDFFVILSGSVAVVQETEDEPRLIAVHGPKRFLGDVAMLTGQRLYLTAIAQEPTEVLAVPVDNLKEAATDDPGLGDRILRAFLARRSLQMGIGAGFRIIGSRFSRDARRLREFASRNRLSYKWIDLEQDREAEAILQRLNISPEQTPVVIWKGRNVLYNPSNEELASLIGLRSPAEGACDLLVVGAGPAVMVVGGGNSAGQASVFLAKHAAAVNLVIRHEDLGRDMSRYLADPIERTPRIRVWRNSEIVEPLGETVLEEVVIEDLGTGDRRQIPAAALFVLIGSVPHTQWLNGQLPLDERGFVVTGQRTDGVGPDNPCGSSMFETACPGVFAVGDVRSGSVKRVASAVGEGAVVVRLVHEFMAGSGGFS